MEKWVTLSDACRMLGVTERTVQRYIKEEKHPSKLSDGRRYVLLEVTEGHPTDDGNETNVLIRQLQSEVEYLRHALSDAQGALSDMVLELSESSQRSDTIIMKLTGQLEQSHLQLEDLRQKRTVWGRLKARFVPETV